MKRHQLLYVIERGVFCKPNLFFKNSKARIPLIKPESQDKGNRNLTRVFFMWKHNSGRYVRMIAYWYLHVLTHIIFICVYFRIRQSWLPQEDHGTLGPHWPYQCDAHTQTLSTGKTRQGPQPEAHTNGRAGKWTACEQSLRGSGPLETLLADGRRDGSLQDLPTLIELERQLRAAKPCKAMGMDRIPSELLHHAWQRLAHAVWPLWNSPWPSMNAYSTRPASVSMLPLARPSTVQSQDDAIWCCCIFANVHAHKHPNHAVNDRSCSKFNTSFRVPHQTCRNCRAD